MRWALVALLLAGCSDDEPLFAGGTYTISLTNRQNGCAFPSWTEGSTASNISLLVTQAEGESAVTGEIMGFAGAWADLVLGSRALTGSVRGVELRMTLSGTRQLTQAGCSYNIVGTLRGTLDGDVLTGTLDYTTATNRSPDCGTLEGCHTVQDFNGTRPPTP